MRIVAGELKGRTFVAPAGQETRPTTDRVREAVFSTFFSELGGWSGVRALDLYAGSGAFGFEALSRGAIRAVGVDDGRAPQRAIESNVSSLALDDRYTLLRRSVAQSIGQLGQIGPFDLVYLDPPYAVPAAEVATVLSSLAEVGALAEGAVIGYEHQRRAVVEWPDGFEPVRAKEYGYTAVSYAIYRGEGTDRSVVALPDGPAVETSAEEGGSL